MKKKEGFDGQRSHVLPPDVVKAVSGHPLCQGLYITDIGYYPKARFHHRERRKGSQECILMYCLQGQGWYQLGSEKHEISANQVVILPARVPHQYGANPADPWSIYWLHFSGLQADSFQQFLHGSGQTVPITIVPNDERFRLFDDIFAHLTMSFNPDNLIFAACCLSHFLATFRESVYKQAVQADTGDAVSASIDFMKQRLHQSLTLAQLADQAGLSISHYSALFRRKTQSSPMNFFNFLRMQEACRLLENTTMRIKEIAAQLGFNDPYHFSRTFHQFIRHSPRQYRHTEKG